MTSLSSGKSWYITPYNKQAYLPILSPDKKKLVIHERGNFYIYDFNGCLITPDGIEGIATSWSPDGDFILFFISNTEDGHSMTGSDLFIYRVIDKKVIKLTNTKDMAEGDASWSVHGIVFTDYFTGYLYTAQIEID